MHLQEVMPHAGSLQKAASASRHWKIDDVEASSSHMALVQPLQASYARQGHAFDSAGSESSTYHAAMDASPGENRKTQNKTGGGEGRSATQLSDEASFQCLRDAALGKFRSLAQMNEEIETSIEELANVSLDTVPRQPSVTASFDTCRTTLRRDSSSHIEAMDSSEHDSNVVGDELFRHVDELQEGLSPLKDMDADRSSTCNSTNAGGKRRQVLVSGLLGESGETLKAVHEAMKKVKDVHNSDELMHFEFCGPFWELTEV
jgi:hypothetical protein